MNYRDQEHDQEAACLGSESRGFLGLDIQPNALTDLIQSADRKSTRLNSSHLH